MKSLKRLGLLCLMLTVTSIVLGQDRPLKDGLPDACIDSVDSRGYIHWEQVRATSLQIREIVELIQKRKAGEAESILRRELAQHKDDPELNELLFEVVLRKKDETALRQLERYYSELEAQETKPALVVLLAHAKVLLKLCASDVTSDQQSYDRMKGLLVNIHRRIDRSNVVQCIQLADIYRSDAVSELETARAVMASCVERSETNVPAHYFLMLLYNEGVLASSQQIDNSRRPFRQGVIREASTIIKLDPTFRQAYYIGGCALFEEGKSGEAKQWLQKYIDLHPTKTGPIYEDAIKRVGH